MKINYYDYGPIGERIKNARKAKQYTQEQLSEIINMNSKNISQLERGITGISVSTLIALCNALDVAADYILFGVRDNCRNNTVNMLMTQLSEKEQMYAEQLLAVYVEACKNK